MIPMHGPAARFPVAPVVLIALGVIFLLDNLDLLDFSRALRYWPVALIALGAYMLYARMSTPGGGGPVMNGNIMCAVRGPILMITLGVLLAIDQMGTLSFSRTWPVLLIEFGLFKLAERGISRQA